jgi:hypothetical protein
MNDPLHDARRVIEQARVLTMEARELFACSREARVRYEAAFQDFWTAVAVAEQVLQSVSVELSALDGIPGRPEMSWRYHQCLACRAGGWRYCEKANTIEPAISGPPRLEGPIGSP